ncbi:hemoblobin-interacting domain-containing protein [Paenibacillus sp. N3.4]|uniref:hemoblobin-interacting domain-containing protein n=1 Tax=Paenibacillus sp. N3.4 TaxID=2603222 RepID=UPI0011D7B4E6|nr:hemoblobin-interacting domain-containing protein [Paenibacillus sp. N3.4]TXK80373.1 DUF1533 domain-containing protein [Paenibacillus sp. N3.4]
MTKEIMFKTMKKVSVYLLLAMLLLSSILSASPASADNSDWKFCVNESNLCSFEGTKEVRYGTDGSYHNGIFTNSVLCNNAAFGDPAPGRAKQCYIRDVLPEGAPRTTAVVSGANKVVTVSFNVYEAQTNTDDALKASITLKRSGASEYLPLGANEHIAFSSTDSTATLIVNLDNALSGNTNSIQIAPGAFKNKSNVPYSAPINIDNIVGADITPPAFVGAESGNQGGDVSLNFDEGIIIDAPEGINQNEFLKSKISVSTDGVNFVPFLLERSNAWQSNSRQIYLQYYDRKIILGTNTIIKIASGTIKDAAGNLNGEMNLHVSPPVIQSTEIAKDSGNHKVVITFNENISDNTNGNLKNSIYLVRATDSSWINLVNDDRVDIDSGKLIIQFKRALSGTNQIFINGQALKNSYGNVQGDSSLTSLIKANGEGDTTVAKYVYSRFLNSYQDLQIVFDKDVHNAFDDDASFLQNVNWDFPGNYSYNGLPSDTTLSFEGHIATIHFAKPLTGNQYYFRFNPNNCNCYFFKDTAGNKVDNNIEIGSFYPQDPNKEFSVRSNKYFSHDGRWMSLQFDSRTGIVDQTLDEKGLSHLKEKITISLNNDGKYEALKERDVVSIVGNRINIIFHDGIKDYSVKVKIDAGVIGDLYDIQRNRAVDELVVSTPSEITGYVFSDAASEFVFVDNDKWRNNVKNVTISDENLEVYRQLTNAEYKLTEGKLVINDGVFQKGHYYLIEVDAEGYNTRRFNGRANKSSEIFYMTAPVVTAENGITARINLFNHAKANGNNNGSIGTQAVVFELFNGSTPVSIVSSNLKVDTGTYSANFNVSDAAGYTVKAFVVSKYSADSTNIGLNLATVMTQLELDQAMMNADYNNVD